jgi:hypothetical protein
MDEENAHDEVHGRAATASSVFARRPLTFAEMPHDESQHRENFAHISFNVALCRLDHSSPLFVYFSDLPAFRGRLRLAAYRPLQVLAASDRQSSEF